MVWIHFNKFAEPFDIRMIIGRSSVLGLSIPLPISSDMGKSCVGLRSMTRLTQLRYWALNLFEIMRRRETSRLTPRFPFDDHRHKDKDCCSLNPRAARSSFYSRAYLAEVVTNTRMMDDRI